MRLIGYFRQSITNFCQKAKVLFDFLKGEENTKRSKQPIQWEKTHQEALDELLTQLTTPTLLPYPNFDSPYILYTDVSSSGIGC